MYLIQGGKEGTSHKTCEDQAHSVLWENMFFVVLPVLAGFSLFVLLRLRERGRRNGCSLFLLDHFSAFG